MITRETMISVDGNLEDYPFPRVLQFLHERSVTGRLSLKRGALEKVVFMVEGSPVNVQSTLRNETLGRYLIKKGKISEEDYDESIKLMIDENIQQGAALVKLGRISARDLYHEVKAQTKEKLLSCFAWTSGEFEFIPDVDFVEDIYRFEMKTEPVMSEGVMRFFPPGAAEKELARAASGPVALAPDFMDRVSLYDLGDKESAFVLQVDGESGLLDLKEKAFSEAFVPKLLYLLLVTALLGPEGRPDERVRGMGGREVSHPPIEDFVLKILDTAPEVVEEEYSVDGPGKIGDSRLHPPDESEVMDWDSETISDQDLTASEDEVMDGWMTKASKSAEAVKEPPAPAPLSPPGKRDESEILVDYMGIKSADFFTLLGVEKDAEDMEIKKAYREVRAEYDVSNFRPGLSKEALDKLEEINAQIIRAYETLRTGTNRTEYLKKLRDKPQKPKVKSALLGEQYLQKGISFVRKRDWPNAQKYLEMAVESKPEEPEYLGYLGWAKYSNEKLNLVSRREGARELLQRAIELNPHMDSAHVFLGKLLRDEGKIDRAIEEFETAILCNPKCREAKRELDAHEREEW